MAGYIDDLDYPHFFHREMTPVWIAALLAGRGWPAPDIRKPYRWCDLGCGTGFGTALTAAVNPLGQFTGIDFNARHIAHAVDFAGRAGIGNARFQAADFAAAAADGDGFDFIVCHGVWSWLAPEKREAVLDFIDRRLRPGGVVYLHYMCHPGLSAFAGARQFLRLHAGAGSDRGARLTAGLRLLADLGRAGAGYFAVHPLVLSQGVERALADDPRFLAHELLNEHWQPQHVGDVIRALSGIGCAYAGSANPFDNIDAVCLPGQTAAALAGVADAAMAETIRDLARNQGRRQDLYVRGVQPLAGQARIEALCGFAYAGSDRAPRGGDISFATPIGPVTGAGALFTPLFEALAAGPRNFADLARLPVFRGNAGAAWQALAMALFAGFAHPVLPAGRGDERRVNDLIEGEGQAYGWRAVAALGSALPRA
ncbi:class I SAM-dependent methyltransferase [Zavarzinia compransoris]|uniref:SAM-dependent methyltransferase n=1 Tax=Zavarzinia compransoris TaxID=1264899 RepID=A0A317DT21_9PROT|nr:class I SAM-dependent methyltransferase [Zavarzinia compransoris]PWR17837.1 SAM-dependent methyltransferase [Zavarzinia compransoris]TDP49372.1 methyltransferase family protein [Zavarzinia compransoris]